MSTLKEETAQFRPVDLTALGNESSVTDAMRMSCSLYNAALRDISAGSLSSAKSNLRKATALCPEFNYAMILYGICTFFTGDRTGAMRIFNSVKSPRERSKAMRIYDRLVDDELSVSAADISGARLRRSLETPDDIDTVYTKKRVDELASATQVKPAKISFDTEAGSPPADNVVRITTAGWGKKSGGREDDGEVRRKKAVVTLHRIPELEEEEEAARAGRRVPLIVIILLALALLITSVGWIVSAARNRDLRKRLSAPDPVPAPYSQSAFPG